MSRKLLYAFLVFLLFQGLCPAIEGNDEAFSKMRISLIKDPKRAPGFSLENLNGKKEGLKDYRGKVVFLNFWATWCGPCKEEMRSMEAVCQQFKEKKFVFLTISVDYEGKEIVKNFIEKSGYTFPVLLDSKSEILDRYDVKRIPTTFIIDRTGRLVGKATGPRDWSCPETIAIIESLLK